jgi:hypothetical protein
MKLSSLLRPVKDHLGLRTPGVYRIPCECGRVYIGQTGRSVDIKSYIALTGWVLWRRDNVSPVKYELGSYIPEDDILHSHRCENLKSYIALSGWIL